MKVKFKNTREIAQWISEGSGWTIKSVEDHYLNIVKYQPIKGNSYSNSATGLINMKNNDNECFRWCHIRHLIPQRIKKSDKAFVHNLGYEGIEFSVTIKQINKISPSMYQKKSMKIV